MLFVLIKTYLISFEALDFALGIASLVASAAFSILGWYAITNERRSLVFLFVACALVQPGYIVFKGVAIEERPDTIPANVTLTQFIILGSLAVILRALLLVSAIRCYCDFGRGLMQVRCSTAAPARLIGVVMIFALPPLCIITPTWAPCHSRAIVW